MNLFQSFKKHNVLIKKIPKFSKNLVRYNNLMKNGKHTQKIFQTRNALMLMGVGLASFALIKFDSIVNNFNNAECKPNENSNQKGKEGTAIPMTQYTISNIAEKVSASCVMITCPKGAGSGFVLDKSGTIVTCFHVVEDSPYPTVTFSDGSKRQARVITTDRKSDIAILKIDAQDLPNNLVPVELDTSNATRLGEFCLTMGANLGLFNSVKLGIISAFRVSAQIDPNYSIDYFIQTDIGVNRGCSGSPLFNLEGKVIGMALMKANGEDVSYWIPSKTLSTVIDQLTKKGKVTRVYLGIKGLDLTISTINAIQIDKKTIPNVDHGVLVTNVFDSTSASEGDLSLNDVILEVEGKRIYTMIDLRDGLGHQIGKKLSLKVARLDSEGKTVILNKTIITKE